MFDAQVGTRRRNISSHAVPHKDWSEGSVSDDGELHSTVCWMGVVCMFGPAVEANISMLPRFMTTVVKLILFWFMWSHYRLKI